MPTAHAQPRRASNSSPRGKASIAIVGAGPGGLSAAMLLAGRGVDVTIYESQPVIGGRTSRISLSHHGDDFHFDRGPTFFLMPYVLEEIFSAAGRRLTDEVELTRLDPMYRLLIGQPGSNPIKLDCTQDIPEMARRLSKLDPADGPAFERFIADNRTKLRLMEPILRSPIRGVMDLMSAGTMKFLPHLHPLTSVHGLLSKYFKHPASRLAVSFQSKYLGMSPYECPSLFTILPFIEYEYGIWHPAGGCNAIMHAMARVVMDMGVKIETSAPVEKIEFEGRRARGVVINGELRRHDHVVVNADAAWALKNLIPESLRGTDTDASIDAKRYSCSTYMMYLGLDGEVDLPHHTIYISEKYKENLDNISTNGRLSEDPSVYVCNPCVTDRSLAPRSSSALYVLMPTPNTRCDIDWDGAQAKLEHDTITQMERRFGIKDVRRRTRVKQVFSPRDWQGLNINFGATFNLAHNLGQMLHKRPPHRLTTVDGVWLVGGGTHPGSGLPVIFLSSQITARLLCEELGLPAPAPGRRLDVDQAAAVAREPAAVAGGVPA
ncbi:MAG: phytoene desaturase family protein [Phycisphaerales bacterium]